MSNIYYVVRQANGDRYHTGYYSSVSPKLYTKGWATRIAAKGNRSREQALAQDPHHQYRFIKSKVDEGDEYWTQERYDDLIASSLKGKDWWRETGEYIVVPVYLVENT